MCKHIWIFNDYRTLRVCNICDRHERLQESAYYRGENVWESYTPFPRNRY